MPCPAQSLTQAHLPGVPPFWKPAQTRAPQSRRFCRQQALSPPDPLTRSQDSTPSLWGIWQNATGPHPMPQRPLTCSLLLAALLGPADTGPLRAADDPADLCLAAAADAAATSGVPYPVLLAVMLVETGRDGRPWPWTVNLDGTGHWLDSAGAAEDLAAKAVEQGVFPVDLGCFQLNHRWHGAAFPTLADMLDPGQNAAYAAAYLARHHAETGDWASAAGAYHSATPDHAERYRTQFETTLAGLDPGLGDDPGPATVAMNGFPLLVAGQAGQNGSLVPATAGGLRLIGGP